MSRPGPRPAFARPLLADRGVVATVALLLTVLVLGASTAATWLRVTADEMAEEVFGSAPWSARQLHVTYAGVIDGAVPDTAGQEIRQELPPVLQERWGEPRHAAVLPEGIPQALPRRDSDDPLFMGVVGLPRVREQLEIVEGRFPRSGHEERQLPPAVSAATRGWRTAPVVEVVLHRTAAREMNLPVGTYLSVNPLRYAGAGEERTALLHIVGTYQPAAPPPAPMDDLSTVREPAISTIPEANSVRASAVAADPRTVLGAPWQGRPEVRFVLDPVGTPDAAAVDQVALEARRLAVRPWPPVVESEASTATTLVGELATSYLDRRGASDLLTGLALAALAAAALATVVVAASVLEQRRRHVTDVLRARGASVLRLLWLRGAEAQLLAAPGLAGALALVLLGPGSPEELLPALVADLVVVALVALVQVAPWQGLPERVRVAVRDALQLAVVLLAAGGVALLWQRQDLVAGDPLLWALPGLLGVAVAVLAVRGVQQLTALVRRVTSGGSGLGVVVGTSQAGAAAARAMLPVTAVVLAGAAVVLTLAVGDTLTRAAERSGWREVGADVTVEGGAFDQDLVARVEQLPGVRAVAAVRTTSRALLETRIGGRRVTMVAVAPAAMREVTAEAPAGVPVQVPAADGEALRVLASTGLDLADSRTAFDYADTTVPVEVVGRVPEVPGVDVDDEFLVVAADAFRAAVDRQLSSYDTLLVAGDPDPAELAGLVREVSPQATVTTRVAVTRSALETAVVARTLAVVRAVAVSAGVLVLLGALLAVGMGHPLRRRTQALLRDLGADPRQARWTTALELVPVMAAAGAVAVGGGLVLVAVLGHGVDVAGLTGIAAPVSVGLAAASWWGALAGVAALLVSVVLAADRGVGSREADRGVGRGA